MNWQHKDKQTKKGEKFSEIAKEPRQAGQPEQKVNMSQRPRIWENTFKCLLLQSISESSIVFQQFFTIHRKCQHLECSLALFYDKEDNLHLTICQNVHRHFINIWAHFSNIIFFLLSLSEGKPEEIIHFRVFFLHWCLKIFRLQNKQNIMSPLF